MKKGGLVSDVLLISVICVIGYVVTHLQRDNKSKQQTIITSNSSTQAVSSQHDRSFDVVVISTVVKKVDEGYEYHFEIINNDKRSINGGYINIALYTKDMTQTGGNYTEIINGNPFISGMRRSVVIKDRMGPEIVIRFIYQVVMGGTPFNSSVVKTGKGTISSTRDYQ
jgi:hypothetical protein